ncbi:MAG: hypothetical protein A2157_17800 [Deltaproteobacteria bacterium RBG_16_47_11]|nr:MAG: hypothetical protein A2157_17800 [Deltaproteobacteria bacterium RBG_16_47_11]
MEKFGYNKAWKGHKFMACGYPIIGLLAILAYWVFLMLPSKGSAVRVEFKWWIPLLAIALAVWAVRGIKKFRTTIRFSVELSDDSIRIGDEGARWNDITKIDFSNAIGEDVAITLHTSDGKAMRIPAAIERLQYIKGFIESHTKDAIQTSKS